MSFSKQYTTGFSQSAKRFVLALAFLLLAARVDAQDLSVNLDGPTHEWAWGEKTLITFPIRLEDGPDLAAIRVQLKYDGDLLKFVDVAKGKSLKAGNALSGFTLNEPGVLTMNFASIEGVKGDGDLFLVNFHLIPSGISGGSSELSIDVPLAARADNEAEIPVEPVTANFNLLAQILGLPLSWLVGAGVGLPVFLLILRKLLRRKKKEEEIEVGERRVQPQDSTTSQISLFCPNCGTQIQMGHKFCGGCGKEI